MRQQEPTLVHGGHCVPRTSGTNSRFHAKATEHGKGTQPGPHLVGVPSDPRASIDVALPRTNRYRVYPRVCGEPRVSAGEFWRPQVYPRVCGEPAVCKVRCSRPTVYPASRETGNRSRNVSIASGLSPRLAGKPDRTSPCRRSAGVYPRVCGETVIRSMDSSQPRGLSPRLRGNRVKLTSNLHVHGSIPRLRGNRQQLATTEAEMGLSPRLRGNREPVIGGSAQERSIPASAGKPRRPDRRSTSSRVYPRVCGETGKCPVTGTHVCGLSPRLRGNRSAVGVVALVERSIPASAGKPVERFGAVPLSRVYPRVCGETDPRGPSRIPAPGLSPRLRGNLGAGAVGAHAGGSIPAWRATIKMRTQRQSR